MLEIIGACPRDVGSEAICHSPRTPITLQLALADASFPDGPVLQLSLLCLLKLAALEA